MKLLSPVTLDNSSGMVSSTVPEDDYPAWVAGTSYTASVSRVIRTTTHKVYESITGGISATPPEDALGGDTPEWIEVRHTNRWSMFNDRLTEASTFDDDITVVVNAGTIDGVALFGVVGEKITVIVTDTGSSEVIFTETREIDGSVLAEISDWFFVDPVSKADMIFTGIPPGFWDVTLTIEIKAVEGVAGCDVCKFGQIVNIGPTLYGASIGIIDYSIEELDTFGYLDPKERGFLKSVTAKMQTTKAEFSRIFNAVSSRRAKPTVYITTDVSGYEPLIVYGLFYDFSIDITYPQYNYCSLVVHGMVQG